MELLGWLKNWTIPTGRTTLKEFSPSHNHIPHPEIGLWADNTNQVIHNWKKKKIILLASRRQEIQKEHEIFLKKIL